MNLSELKELIDDLDCEDDDYPIYKDFLSGEQAEITLNIVDYLGHKYLQIDIN